MKLESTIYMEVSHSVFAQCRVKQKFILAGNRLSSCQQHGFLRYKENVSLWQKIYTLGVLVLVYPVILCRHKYGDRFYSHSYSVDMLL